MIKPKSEYIMLTPSGNAAIIGGKLTEATKYTMQKLSGAQLKQLLAEAPPISVAQVKLFEIKQELLMQPVTTITISPAELETAANTKGKPDVKK